MESPPPDFLWGLPRTLPLHLHSSPSCSLFLSPISALSRPQSFPIGLYFSPGPPPSPGELSDSLVLLHKLPECLFNSTQDPTISGDHGRGIGVGIGYTPLLESNTPSICEGSAMKKEIINNNNNNKYNKKLLTLRDIPGNPAQHTHTSCRG